MDIADDQGNESRMAKSLGNFKSPSSLGGEPKQFFKDRIAN